jgi:formyltetrahydrofolate deformylase
MQVILTAVGPDHRGLADPIVHHVTDAGANISEIQMYDHDSERLFAMLLRMDWPVAQVSVAELRARMFVIGRDKNLSIRVWSPEEHSTSPRLALLVTHRREPAQAVLDAVRAGSLHARVEVMIGNRPSCSGIAEEAGVAWHHIGNHSGVPDNAQLLRLLDQYAIDYVVLARYMRMVPATICWQYGGGRIVNLHPGLMPPAPGGNPYQEAYLGRMLVFGATVHFVSPGLGLGGQIIHQDTFAVCPGTPLEEIIRLGHELHEPACLLEGLRRVVHREVELRFHKVVPRLKVKR